MGKKESIDVVIPQDAVEIKVINVINPYFIRVCELPENRKKKSSICKYLQKIVKSKLEKDTIKPYVPAVGDDVIVSNHLLNSQKIDLPDWLCRGVVTDTTMITSDIFLLDFGIVINVPTDSLIKYPRNCISDKPLTITVGMYNLLPIDTSPENTSGFCLTKYWSSRAINLIKELIQFSKKIYFEVLAYNKQTDQKYGDIFLVIENTNICLSKVLIHSLLAINLSKDLLRGIKNNVVDKSLIPYEFGCENSHTSNDTVPLTSDPLSDNKRIFSKKQKMNEKILVHSKLPCQPLEHVTDARFIISIHEVLKNNGLRTLKHIQSYMWPAIKKGLNVTAIGSQSSGKTVGYIVPIGNSVAASEEIILEKQNSSSITKPTVLILCASVHTCINVTSKCKDVLYYCDKIKAFAAFNGLTDKELMANICNKFHILVSTPPFLLRMLKMSLNKLNISELSYLVIEEADILLNKYLAEFMALIRDNKLINKDNYPTIQGGSMQIITVAQTWNDRIRSFTDMFVIDPYVCIGSFIEAAAFSKVQGRMLIRHSDKKKYEILGAIGNHQRVKTIIFCLNSTEAIELNEFLLQNSIKTLLAHEELKITNINEIREEWIKYIPGMYPIIVCADPVIPDLDISDAEFVIHYSITNTSKTQFSKRFSVLMDNWQMEVKNRSKVLIFFDETKENVHFKGVTSILKRLNVEFPRDWDQIADGLDLSNNIKKKNYPLCNSIKTFGICEANTCPYRHRVIVEEDAPTTNITIGDDLKLHVTFVHNASHFSARILEYTRVCEKTGKKKTISLPHAILKLNLEMKKYYSNSDNRRMEKNISVGKICAIKSPQKKYFRVKILNIVERDVVLGTPRFVRLQSMDDGQILERIHVHELYELPDQFLQFQFPIVNVFITNIAPFDDEYKWTDIASTETLKWFQKYCDDTTFPYIKVLLHIGDSIWTDSVVGRCKLIGYPDLETIPLTAVLKEKGHGTENQKHLPSLIQLCFSGGLREVNGQELQSPINKDTETNVLDKCD